MSNLIKSETYQKIQDKFIEHGNVDKATFNKEVSFAVQHFSKNKYLQDCTIESALKAVLNISQTGLTLNPVSKYAYLVPRYNSQLKSKEVVLEPSYVGLVKLLTDSGSVLSINTQLVYENDKFDMDLALGEISHKPELVKSKRGEFIGCYSIAILANGGSQVEWMDFEELNGIRDYSESYKAYKSGKTKSCIWVESYGEMCRKTVIKRIYKHLPKTKKVQNIEQAISIDNDNNGFREKASFGYLSYAEQLINQSALPMEIKESIELKLDAAEYTDEVSEIVEELKKHQPETLDQQFDKKVG